MFYFIHVQGQNALTTLLHLADEISPRKKFNDYPDIESGIVHCRIGLPDNIKSLPYATRISDVNIMIKHNQCKV